MSKFLLPILAGVVMVIISGCGGAAAPSTDETKTTDDKTETTDGTDTDDDTKTTDGETKTVVLTPEQIEMQRQINKRLANEITACGATCAGYAEWLTANPNLPPVPIEEANRTSGNNTGHYLQGTRTGLAGGAVVTTVTFEDVFDDVNDNPFDGFAYFGGDDDKENRRRYVGILSGTNMGAPLTTTVGRSIWKGFISGGDAFTTPTAFNLMVNFNATGGTIAAFIPTSLNRIAFRIDGEFDAKGVITGITDRRTYRDKTDVSTYDASSRVNTVGTLRGLIGSDGAVGVFTTDAEDAPVPYAGGFVAQPGPLLPAPDHALYVSAFSPPPAVENLGTQEGVSGLSQPTAEGFSPTGLRFEKRPSAQNDDCRSCFPNLIVRLSGDNTDIADTDGFAMIYGRLNAGSSVRVRAGLLPGTDVGAFFGNVAFDGATTANWPGTIYHSRQIRGTNPNKVLAPFNVAFTVDFAAGTFVLPDTVLANRGLSNQQTISVAGRFGEHAEAVEAQLPEGVLGGKVYYTNGSNAVVEHALQGLIGTEGAVGVFELGGTNTDIGGFVARNAPVLVNHASYLAQNTDLQLTTNTNSAFVRGLDNGSGLDTSGVNFTANDVVSSCQSNTTKCILEHTLRLGGNNADTNDPSGLAIFYGNRSPTNVNAGGAYRVGLLSGTDVGLALPSLAPDGRATAQWSGKLYATRDATDGIIPLQDLTLTVDYTARTISGQVSITGGVLAIGGGYNQTGIMTGSGAVTYTPSVGDVATFNLRGIIGTEGAVGIFQGRGDQHHVGGFIAKPPAL